MVKITALVISLLGLAVTATAETALEAAQARNVCNGAEVVAAEFLADGRLSATCRPGATTGTGLAPGAAAGGLIALGALLALGGSSSTSSSASGTN
jgi:hypothetical protein